MILPEITREDLALLTPKELEELEGLLLAQEAIELSGSFRHYVRAAWHIVEPEIQFVPGWHIDAMSDHLEAVSRGEIRKLLINVPPGHMKSLEVSVFWPTWEWTRNPVLRYLFASYNSELATRDSVKSRRIIESNWYQERWGGKVRLAPDQNLKTRYENTATGYRISGGLSHTGERGDRLVVDDPHNVKEIESDVQRKAVLDWWDQVMSMRGSDPKTVAKVLIMQRVHEKDLAGHVLAEGGWTHLCLPAEYEPKHPFVSIKDERKVEGELLWPERYGEKEIAEAKKPLGTYGTAGQLQQRPSPAGGGIFRTSWWKTFTEPPKFTFVLQSWDTALKEKQTADYSVCTTWGVADDGFYLLDVWRNRVEMPGLKRAMKDLASKWKPNEIIVEDKGSGTSAMQELRETSLPLIAIQVDTDKVLRARAVTPTLESGRGFLPEIAQWRADFIAELEGFPTASHDDQVDSVTQALNRLRAGAAIIDYYAAQVEKAEQRRKTEAA